ncbi:MAG: ABC transporter ATP-binding protein [Deinococcales bacterium]
MLELTHLNLQFGGLKALSDVNFKLNQGEILSIIGPNGAGKSSLLNVITGIYKPISGDIHFQGQSTLKLSPHQITRLGIARTFQNLRLYLNMSVLENVMTGAYCQSRAGLLSTALRLPSWRKEEAEIRAKAEHHLSFFGNRLQGYRHQQPAYSLSYANRRRLEIARAMTTGASLLLLDEPAAGMNPHESAEIAEVILRLRDEGYTILLIEHDMNVVARASDRVIVLDYGKVIAQGSFAEVTEHPEVIAAYLGRKAVG